MASSIQLIFPYIFSLSSTKYIHQNKKKLLISFLAILAKYRIKTPALGGFFCTGDKSVNKQYFSDFGFDLDDIDYEFNDMIKSLTFRNRPDRKEFRFIDDELPQKRKRNHHRPRARNTEVF